MAGRTRKTTSTSTGKIGKAAKLDRAIQEEKLKTDRDALLAPEWLDEFAKVEFERVVDEAGNVDLLDNLDLSVLALYANAFSRYIQTVKEINRYGEVDADTGRINTCVMVQEKYVKQIMNCSTKLGLAATDRLKLIVPNKDAPKKNRLLEFVK